MTIFDLLFILSFLTFVGTSCRIVYLYLRGSRARAIRLSARLAIFVLIYFAALFGCSAVQRADITLMGESQCFDDFCIIVDSAARRSTLAGTAANGDFVVVTGRIVSRAARRRQRETDIAGLLRIESGKDVRVSQVGEDALRSMHIAGHDLTDFVEPLGSNDFRLAYDVPKTSHGFDFVVHHGAFPGALIIGSSESLFHRRTVVPLLPLSASAVDAF